MTHTPGPWTYEMESHNPTGLPRFDGPVIYALQDCEYHPIADASCNHTCRMEWDTEANAKLICAAPELLDVLRTIYDVWGVPSGMVERVQAVISKATAKP